MLSIIVDSTLMRIVPNYFCILHDQLLGVNLNVIVGVNINLSNPENSINGPYIFLHFGDNPPPFD